jgi:cytochrome P450
MSVVFNPFEPGFADDPYPHYRQLREHDPVHLSPLGVWMLFGYSDCFTLLRDPRASVDPANERELSAAARAERVRMFEELFPDRVLRESTGILFIDPPDHTRLRKLVSKAFTPRRVAQLRPKVQELVDRMLDEVAPLGEMELIADLAFPLPFIVISDMLGMPEADQLQLREWSHTMVKMLDPVLSPEEMRAAVLAAEHMFDHVAEVIAWKRDHLADDLLSALITAEEDGDVLTPEELADQVSLLFLAGHETTVNLIGNGVLALLRNRRQLELLQGDPSVDANAVEELLRYDSPVQFSRRITMGEVRFGGHVIEPGRFVMTCLGAANHDPAVFGPDADQLDLRRPSASRHLSFGSGIHHCLGASLARLEGQVAIGTLVRRFPDLELATDHPRWNGRIVLRGVEELPLTFSSTTTVRRGR